MLFTSQSQVTVLPSQYSAVENRGRTSQSTAKIVTAGTENGLTIQIARRGDHNDSTSTINGY